MNTRSRKKKKETVTDEPVQLEATPVTVNTEDEVSEEVEPEVIEKPAPIVHEPESHVLQISVSRSLYNKINTLAKDQRINVEQYVVELLAEGTVMRAWETLEKRMRSHHGQGHQQHRHHNQHRNNGNRYQDDRRGNDNRGNTRGRMSQSRYQNIMDDKASFLEYVRNLDKKNR